MYIRIKFITKTFFISPLKTLLPSTFRSSITGFFVLATVVLNGDVAFSNTIRIEQTKLTYSGQWQSESGYGYSGNSAYLVNYRPFDPGAFATLDFFGVGITWIGARTFNAGLFEWVIDEDTPEERSGIVNTYIEGVERVTSELLADDLSPGQHRLLFTSLGVRGSDLQSGLPSETYIDAFDIKCPENGECSVISPPNPTPIPAPASTLFLLTGVFGLAALFRSSRRESSS